MQWLMLTVLWKSMHILFTDKALWTIGPCRDQIWCVCMGEGGGGSVYTHEVFISYTFILLSSRIHLSLTGLASLLCMPLLPERNAEPQLRWQFASRIKWCVSHYWALNWRSAILHTEMWLKWLWHLRSAIYLSFYAKFCNTHDTIAN